MLKKQYEQDRIYKRYKLAQTNKIESQEKNYHTYINKISSRNSVKFIQRGSSLLVIAWGFGGVSTSSIIATYLRALMHADSNIQCTKYQNLDQMTYFLIIHGYADS